MKTLFICTRLELEGIDTTYLTMNNLNVTASLMEGLQAIVEGESFTMLFTESVLDEQMTDEDFINYIHLVNSLYPKKPRFIYLKRRRNADDIVEALYTYNNWDIHYNTKVTQLDSTEIIRMIEERKIPDSDYKKRDSIEEVLVSGKNMKDALLDSLKSNRDFSNNVFFQSTVTRNMSLVRDMAIAFDLTIKELNKSVRSNNLTVSKLSKLNKDMNDLVIELNETKESLSESQGINGQLLRELTLVQSKYNSLVNILQDLMYVERSNTLNHRHKRVDHVSLQTPTIIYLKQVSHVNHLTSYMSNLAKIMTQSVGLTKLYIIESETNLISVPRYEKKGFSYVTDGTSLPEVILKNLISCGLESKLLDFLIDNSLNVDYLIVVDKTGTDFDLISGHNVLKIMGAKSLNDLKIVGLQDNISITNDVKQELSIPVVKNYLQFENNYQLEMSLISSLPITKLLIKIFNEFKNSNSTPQSEVIFDKKENNEGEVD